MEKSERAEIFEGRLEAVLAQRAADLRGVALGVDQGTGYQAQLEIVRTRTQPVSAVEAARMEVAFDEMWERLKARNSINKGLKVLALAAAIGGAAMVAASYMEGDDSNRPQQVQINNE